MFSYVEAANSNIVCCICRAPFVDPVTSRTCSHTFCHDCIESALVHSPHCPVDRSPLSPDDLSPSNPIIRALVDELLVQCPNTECTHVCQRQLLASHLKASCPYTLLPCPTGGCSQLVSRRDMHQHRCAGTLATCEECGLQFETSQKVDHYSECPTKCLHCSAELNVSQLFQHYEECPQYTVPCSHAKNGCSWSGERQLLPSHLSTCSYEAIKGFFSIFRNELASLTEENLILKHKIESLEGGNQMLQKELLAAKTALGPWYKRNDGLQRLQASTVSPDLQETLGYFPSDGPSLPSETVSVTERPCTPPLYRSVTEHIRTHRTNGSTLQGWESSQHPTQHNIAPLDLSTSLEGSLLGLRESLITLATSLDSLGRRSNIALTNETLRLNEEIMSLRANIHGLRMQVHAMMVSRNVEVTGRFGSNQNTKL